MAQWVRDGGLWKFAPLLERRDGGLWKEPSIQEGREGSAWKRHYAPEVLAPSGDVSATGAWEDTTGGDGDGAFWDELVGETADLTSYVRALFATSDETLRVALADPTKTHGVFQRHWIRGRIRPWIDAGEPDIEVTATLFDTTTGQVGTPQTFTFTETDSGNWFPIDYELADGASPSDYSATEIELFVDKQSTGFEQVACECAWLALDIN